MRSGAKRPNADSIASALSIAMTAPSISSIVKTGPNRSGLSNWIFRPGRLFPRL